MGIMSMTERKPTWLRLPCSRCVTEIPELIEGVTIRCLQCGADNTFYESKRYLEKKAKALGISGFVVKPADKYTMAGVIRSVLG